MAEFPEVMLQTVRMCESMANCETCPLFTHDDCGEHICPFTWSGMPTMEYFHRVEKIAMDWATKHPASTYPTWEEWRVANFPDTSSPITPCHFMTTSEWYDISGCVCEDCAVCRSRPIPAYIAKKLGVKPKEGANA